MTKQQIEIIIPCGQNSDHYLDYFIKNALETCSNEYDLVFSLGINNYDAFDTSFLEKYKDYATFNVTNVPTNTELGSFGHAEVLNKLFEKCTAEFCLVADCDIAFLVSDWDKKLIECLDEKTIIVGTEYHKYSNLPKYVDFPNAQVCLFKTQKMKELKLDFTPQKGSYIIKNENEAFWWGRPVGSIIYLDTGCMIPVIVKSAGFLGKVINFCQPKLLGCGQEFYLDNVPFLTHLKGSCVHSINDGHTQRWLGTIANFVNQNGICKRKLKI